MNRLLLALCLALCSSLVACGGSSGGHLPVDSPLTPFQPPHEDELVEQEGEGYDALDDYDDLDNVDAAQEDWGAVDAEPSAEPPETGATKAAPAKSADVK